MTYSTLLPSKKKLATFLKENADRGQYARRGLYALQYAMGASRQEIYKIFLGGWDKYIPVSDFTARRKPRLSKYHLYYIVSALHILGGEGGFFRDKGADGFDISAAAYTVCCLLPTGCAFLSCEGTNPQTRTCCSFRNCVKSCV